jgi:Nif-specific regulatory protein
MRARLIIEWGEGTPRVCDLSPGQPVTIGRSRDNTLTLHDEHASRLHAKIYYTDGRWLIEDCGTLNGTRLDGERIKGPAPLLDGQKISIGDMHLRFALQPEEPKPGDPSARRGSPEPADLKNGAHAPASLSEEEAGASSIEVSPPPLLGDSMAAMYAFIAASVAESDPRALIRRALATVASQTQASVTGFLSLDKDDPLPKQVWPETARVDFALSRQLTRKVQSEGRAVWLGVIAQEKGSDALDLGIQTPFPADDIRQSDSLLPFHDALCLPLLAEGAPLGALHVYKANKFFTERDLRFCEVVAGFVANSLGRIRVRRALEAENSRLRSHSPVSDELIGTSERMRQLRQVIARAGPRSSIVLIHGETGSGKELVAQDLHRESPSSRRHGPLVVLNCAAIAPTLMEAELFGHVKGAFTGATGDRPGLFQQADEGTLFLDEVGELSLDCQAKLLRVIEGKGFRPVGGTHEIRTDVRVIAATHRDLERQVAENKFRSDLFFRLSVIRIDVPPLREHVEDIPALVDYFLARLAVECGRQVRLTDAALARLKQYSWPGNVRQLRAVLENMVVMSESDVVDACDLLLPAGLAEADHPPSLNLDEIEAWAIRKALHQTAGNNVQAARLLGIARETLASKRKKYKIEAE